MIARNRISNIQHPKELVLAWSVPNKGRYVVGKLYKNERDEVCLQYLPGTSDYQEAKQHRFQPIPSFRKESGIHRNNVMDFFMSRITDRKRPDFDLYLETIGINPEKKSEISDFTLLSYGEARLPSDGYFVTNDYKKATVPFEFVTELSGLQYGDCVNQLNDISPDDEVQITHEADNPHDPNAIVVTHEKGKLGYINRIQAPAIARLLSEGKKIRANVFRKNGRPSRPRMFVFLEIR